MPNPGYVQKVFVRIDENEPTVADEIDGIREFTLSMSRQTEETNDTKDHVGFKKRLATVRDTSIDMSGHFEAGDNVQQLLRDAWLSGATVFVTVHQDPASPVGRRGLRTPNLVESYDSKVSVSGLGEFSAKCPGNGDPVTV